jgi:hypothetical protein
MYTSRVPLLSFFLTTVAFYGTALGQGWGEGLPLIEPQVAKTPALSGILTSSDGVANSQFGASVAISGDTVVIGPSGTPASAYVFQKPADGWSNMVQTAELTPSDAGSGFGTAVAISGNTIVVGANGKAYVFVKPAAGWTNMTETAQLSDGVTGDCFGCFVAIDNQTIVAGAPLAIVNGNQNQGAAYVFAEPATGWVSTSAFAAQLTASDGSFYDDFGISVAVSGKTVVVGAPFYQDRTGPGAAYVYVEPATGWASTTQSAELSESQQGLYDEFGLSVAIDRNMIVVGATQVMAGPNGDGGVYVFVKPATGWANMTETAQLLASSPTQNFGFSVGISGRVVVAGTYSANTNLVFLYSEPKTGWRSTATASAVLSRGKFASLFGFSVAISGYTVVPVRPTSQ